MCHGRFQESLMFEIRLPEDDPEVIRALIQYLYTGNFHDFGTVKSGRGPKGAGSQLARLYVTAEKYQLQVLKNLVLSKFGSVSDPEERPLDFLCMAESMYENTPDTDTTWRTFFKSFAARLQKPNRMSKSIRDIFDNFVYGGGAQAVDMVEAICTDSGSQPRNAGNKVRESVHMIHALAKRYAPDKEKDWPGVGAIGYNRRERLSATLAVQPASVSLDRYRMSIFQPKR